MRPWRRVASETVVDSRWLKVTADTCELPSGTVIEPYFVIHEPEWIHVLAVDADHRILVVRQYRYAADAVCTELPGGAVEQSEAPLEAAKRELREETGYAADEWKYLGALFANPARQTNRVHLYVASGLTHVGEEALDASEDIEYRFASIAEVQAEIKVGTFSQALHVASFYRGIQSLQATGAA